MLFVDFTEHISALCHATMVVGHCDHQNAVGPLCARTIFYHGCRGVVSNASTSQAITSPRSD